MADEIENAEQLIELAELYEVVFHELVASREETPDAESSGLPLEELHAPGSTDESAAVEFVTRVDGHRLGVRCRLHARNAYASFQVDAEAIFSVPAPVSDQKLEIFGQFAEQVGAPVMFPYIRAAVAAMAAQLPVAASPLPLLGVGDFALGVAEEPAVHAVLDDVLAMGPIMKTNDDGSVEQIGGFFIDAETGRVVAVGAEEPESLELLDIWDEVYREFPKQTWEWVVRTEGEECARQLAETIRATDGDAAAEQAIAEINDAVIDIAAAGLADAVRALQEVFGSTKERIEHSDALSAGDERANLVSLLTAAETMVHEFEVFRAVGN